LEGGPPSFPQDFACPVVLRNSSPRAGRRRVRDSHPLWCGFPDHFPYPHRLTCTRCSATCYYCPTTPAGIRCADPTWFGLIPVRSPLLRDSHLILLPRGTEMFQFPRLPSRPYAFRIAIRPRLCGRGLPHSGSTGSSLACSSPVTFRRSPRPSSAFGP
jgi:hypothetical protein